MALSRHPVTVALGVVVVGALILVIQDFRHGFPFSRHHVPAGEFAQRTASPDERGGVPNADRVPVAIEASRRSALGISLATATMEELAAPVHAVATVVPDESRLSHIHARVSGWLEQVEVPPAGATVAAGQPVAAIFSQELFASQSEYLAARASGSGPRSAVPEAARQRLKIFGMNDAEIAAIERDGRPRRLVMLRAPRAGIVLRRGVTVGTAVDPSTEILSIADLSRVWIVAEVPEASVAGIRAGLPATLAFPASGREPFSAAVDFVYPTLSERTRTLRVRFSVENRDGRLRPGLYGSADFRMQPLRVLTVPRDAVVDTGASQHVFVATPSGVFEPRRVQLGTRLTDRVEIREGLAAGESVAASGVFLIDSESRLRASGTDSTHGGHGGTTPKEPTKDEPHTGHPP